MKTDRKRRGRGGFTTILFAGLYRPGGWEENPADVRSAVLLERLKALSVGVGRPWDPLIFRRVFCLLFDPKK